MSYDDEVPSLFDVGPFTATSTAGTIDEQFARFHQANPWVYRALVALARDHAPRCGGHVGIGMLFELVRWQTARTTYGDQFRLNNNFRSRYSRLIAQNEPDLADVFHTRKLTSA